MTERNGELALGGASAEGAAAPRGPGRPAGARNVRGRKWQEWIDASGEHPIAFLARIYRAKPGTLLGTMSPDGDLVLQLKDELALKIRAAEAILPYVEQKLPALEEEDAQGAKKILMVVGNLAPAQATELERRGLQFAVKPPAEDAPAVLELTASQTENDDA